MEIADVAVVVGALAAIVAVIVDVMMRRRDRRNEQRRAHSSTLNREALVPWASIHVKYGANDIASFVTLAPGLEENPAFRRALDHVRTAYPAIAEDWRQVETLLIKRNDRFAQGKQEIARQLSNAVETLFGGAVRPVTGYPAELWEVFYSEPTAGLVWTEVKAILQAPGISPGTEVKSESVGQAAHLGYRIQWRATEIGRVTREVHSSQAMWTGLAVGALNNEGVRSLVREVVAIETEIQNRLVSLRGGIADISNRIDSGLPIDGVCDLGF